VDVDVAERDVVHKPEAEHDHAGDPKEQNVESGHERRRRIIGLELRSLLGPSQGGKRPESGGEPGVQHVRITQPLLPAALRTLGRRGPCNDRFGALKEGDACDDVAGLVGGRLPMDERLVATLAVPGGNLVAPPYLARDTPVFDVAHPAEIIVYPSLGNDADAALLDGSDRRFRQRLDLDEPLRREIWLDDRLAPVAFPERHPVIFNLAEQGSDR